MRFVDLVSGISRALRGGVKAADVAAEMARGATQAAMRSPTVRAGVAGAALGDSLNAAQARIARGDLPGACRCVADGFTAAAKITENQ